MSIGRVVAVSLLLAGASAQAEPVQLNVGQLDSVNAAQRFMVPIQPQPYRDMQLNFPDPSAWRFELPRRYMPPPDPNAGYFCIPPGSSCAPPPEAGYRDVSVFPDFPPPSANFPPRELPFHNAR